MSYTLFVLRITNHFYVFNVTANSGSFWGYSDQVAFPHQDCISSAPLISAKEVELMPTTDQMPTVGLLALVSVALSIGHCGDRDNID